MNLLPVLGVAGGLALTGTAGYLASEALSASSQEPTKTVTISVSNGATGATGPAGPTGPPGPAGGQECPTNSEFGELVINHPGGQTTIFTCIKN